MGKKYTRYSRNLDTHFFKGKNRGQWDTADVMHSNSRIQADRTYTCTCRFEKTIISMLRVSITIVQDEILVSIKFNCLFMFVEILSEVTSQSAQKCSDCNCMNTVNI